MRAILVMLAAAVLAAPARQIRARATIPAPTRTGIALSIAF